MEIYELLKTVSESRHCPPEVGCSNLQLVENYCQRHLSLEVVNLPHLLLINLADLGNLILSIVVRPFNKRSGLLYIGKLID